MFRKAFLSAIVLITVTTVAHAQEYFSCSHREICGYNDKTEKYDQCSGYDENSMFKINAEQTMFVHTTDDIKSAYYIDKKEYNADKDMWTFDVTSDVGNKYIYVMDPRNNEVRIGAQVDGKFIMIVFTVKRHWTE